MTIAQGTFLVAFSLIVVLIVAFVGVVFRSALHTDGGSYVTPLLVRRLLRTPAERNYLNRWAFYLHRISGVAVFAFLCLHIADVSLYTFSPPLYDSVHVLYGSPALRVFECGLLFAVLFHTFNGLRLIAVDLADLGRVAATRTLVGVVVATVLLGGAGSVLMLAPVFT